jgi:hypothetical protein
MAVESMEPRILLHGGGDTLDIEHMAVMHLIDFANIDNVGGGTYYKAKAGNNVGTTSSPTYLWRDPANWLLETWVPGSGTTAGSWAESQAQTIPGTGADAYVPANVTLTYDIGPAALPQPLLTGGPGPMITVKNDLRLHSVGVEGGLTFAPNTDELFYVDTMVVKPTGTLSINETDPTKTARIVIAEPNWANFSLANPFDRNLDPFEFSRGIITHGATTMVGENVTPFITLPSLTRSANNLPAPAAGQPSPGFLFTAPAGTTGWTVGDRLVVAGTNAGAVNPATGASSDEEAVITGVTTNTNGTLTITAAVQVKQVGTDGYVTLVTVGGLQSDHVQPTDPGTVPNATPTPYTNPDGSLMFGIQVTDLTRNVVIQSEDPYHTMARGHVMFMHNPHVMVSGVGFYGLGRSDKRTVVDDVQLYTKDLIDALNQAGASTPGYVPITYDMIGKYVPGTGLDPRGRYPVHFHRAGINEVDDTDPNHPILTATAPAEVQDSVVVDSPGWGFVNHTSYVNFDNNVAFNVVGASFVTEAGNEMGRFVGNLAIKGVGANTSEGIESRREKQDFGFQGDGFWFQGPGVDVENNIAVSQHHDGFVFFTAELQQKYSWVDDAHPFPVTQANLQLVPWGDGTGVQSWGNNLVLVGTDTNGKLHVRVFDAAGNRLLDTDETQLSASQAAYIATLKQQLPGLMPPHVLTAAEKSAVLSSVNTIVGPVASLVTATQGARTTTDILAADGYSPALITALGGPGQSVDPGNVPILKFADNTATAIGTGFESWFHQLDSTYDRSLGSQVVGLKVANTRGTGMFDPYTNKLTVKDTTLIGNPKSPGGTGMDRNSVTANLTYDNVTVRGFNVGVQIPVNDYNLVLGGKYQNKVNFNITTANSLTRTVQFSDKKDASGNIISALAFMPIPNATAEAARINVNLTTSYDPKDRDISKMFNPDIIRMGTVWIDSFGITGGANKQLYYYQQRSDFKPFPRLNEQGQPINYGGPVTDAFGNVVDYSGIEVPPEIFDLTNQQLFSGFGLAIGGTLAPADAVNGMGTYTFTPPGGTPTTASPRISGLIGSPNTYQLTLNTTSNRYTTGVTSGPDVTGTPAASYVFSYRLANAAPATSNTNVTVKVGNFYPASGFTFQLSTITVNGTPVPIPPVPTRPPGITDSQWAAQLRTFYNTTLKLPLREGWNLVSGNLDGTPSTNVRTQLIYGDILPPDLNATTPDQYALRRLSTNAASAPGGVWAPGHWDSTVVPMTGLWVGTTGTTPVTANVSGQFVAVMNPLDLDVGFQIKGNSVDNSFGHRSFDTTITGLTRYLNPNGQVPFLTPVPYPGTTNPYASIMNYATFKGLLTTPSGGTPPAPVYVQQHLQTMFFAVKDFAGNTKTFALTIFLDPTAPRTGGNSNPSGTFSPSASMIALGDLFVIDQATLDMINGTLPHP